MSEVRPNPTSRARSPRAKRGRIRCRARLWPSTADAAPGRHSCGPDRPRIALVARVRLTPGLGTAAHSRLAAIDAHRCCDTTQTREALVVHGCHASWSARGDHTLAANPGVREPQLEPVGVHRPAGHPRPWSLRPVRPAPRAASPHVVVRSLPTSGSADGSSFAAFAGCPRSRAPRRATRAGQPASPDPPPASPCNGRSPPTTLRPTSPAAIFRRSPLRPVGRSTW